MGVAALVLMAVPILSPGSMLFFQSVVGTGFLDSPLFVTQHGTVTMAAAIIWVVVYTSLGVGLFHMCMREGFWSES